MADETAVVRIGDDVLNSRVQVLLAQYCSTVFACDISGDTRYIRCDFNQCTEHGTAAQGKPCWILNTLRNVKTLEKHVGMEINQYMVQQSLDFDLSRSPHYVSSQGILETKTLPPDTQKVLAVFNLKDPQSHFGEWISLFLEAANISEGHKDDCDFTVITQDFVSRHTLIQGIAKLEFLKDHISSVEVIVVLSCHSSCQGQVFSCTPSAISKQCGFEEFCSLHDFVMACQDVLQNSLVAVHISSCFTLKLDCSHSDWPVDPDWLKNKLNCILSGSNREVYETGSQVADLHLVLLAMSPPAVLGTWGERFRCAVVAARSESFPDLASEMGLEVVHSQQVNTKLTTVETDDKVTPPGLVLSSLCVVLIVDGDSPVPPSSTPASVNVALANAIVANLRTRKASDVRCSFLILNICQDKASLSNTQSCIAEKLDTIQCNSNEVLFIALGAMFANPNVGLMQTIDEWRAKHAELTVYGVHFQNISAMQAYYVKKKLKESCDTLTRVATQLSEGRDNSAVCAHLRPLTVTGLIDNGNMNCSAAFPVLLYMIHLAVGENGNRIAGKGIPSGVYSRKPVGCGNSAWTLDEVYMETCHVLSGLSRKCDLRLLSVPLFRSSLHPTSPQEAGRSPHKNTIEIVEGKTGSSRTNVATVDACCRLGDADLPATADGISRCEETCHFQEDYCDVGIAEGGRLEKCLESEGCCAIDTNGAVVRDFSHEFSNTCHKADPPNSTKSLRQSYSAETSEGVDLERHDAPQPSEHNLGVVSGNLFMSELGTREKLVCKTEQQGNATENQQTFGVSSSASENDHVHVRISKNVQSNNKWTGVTKLGVNSGPPSVKSARDSTRTGADSDGKPSKGDVGFPEAYSCRAGVESKSLKEDVESRDSNNSGTYAGRNICGYDDSCEGESRVFPERNAHEEGSAIGEGTRGPASTVSAANSQNVPPKEDTASMGENKSQTSPISGNACRSSLCHIYPEGQRGERIAISTIGTGSSSGVVSVRLVTTSTGGEGGNSILNAVGEDTQSSSFRQASDGSTKRGQTLSREPASPEAMDRENKSALLDIRDSEVTLNKEKTLETQPELLACLESQKRPLFTEEEPITEQKRAKLDGSYTGRSNERTQIESHMDVTSKWDASEDLPLMANVDEVLVTHYILDLSVDFEAKVMRGSIVLFLEPANVEVIDRQFQLNLDSTLVNIESVTEITLPENFKVAFWSKGETALDADNTVGPSDHVIPERQDYLSAFLHSKRHNPLPFKALAYSVYGWCVRIWKLGATGQAWPRCVWIKYNTSPKGQSLAWATDQDGRPCVFSPGAYINNRSLMPCQEPPVAMSTWQASIHVPKGCVVLMSGNPVGGAVFSRHDGQATYSYEMVTPLPCSTLAVAVGWFEARETRNACTKQQDGSTVNVPCRMFAPPSLIDRGAAELLESAPKFVEAACELLGPYPFTRLDILVMPKCFACMGLKSPNLVFLSQSLLAGDRSMSVRLAHEISHAWFGLLVGAKDWTEEWLSEGFATYAEEKIQAIAEKWSRDEERSFRQLRQILRRRALSDELQQTDENQQCLRPKKTKVSSEITDADANQRIQNAASSSQAHTVVKNGQICSKKWSQVCYLKGYFLLHSMGDLVGLEQFNQFLHNYVQHFKGQLVTSEDFFDFFLHSFAEISWDIKDKFMKEWLDCPGMPKNVSKSSSCPDNELVSQAEEINVSKSSSCPDNELVSQAEEIYQAWRKQDVSNKRNHTMRVRRRKEPQIRRMDLSDQVVLLLEKLLERETLSHSTLRQLNKCYKFTDCNAEIRHRWCELVVKHKYTAAMNDVRKFLIEDQGMGIYLFGEMLISGQPKQIRMVEEILNEIGPEMDRCTYRTVQDMLLGND